MIEIEYTGILRSLSAEKFSEILHSSSRQAREAYFVRHGVRAPKLNTKFAKPGAKNEARIQALFKELGREDDDEMAEEILRSWLLTKREMLSAALDHLGIAHENGLTESEEIEKIAEFSPSKLQELVVAIGDKASKEDILLYFKFMGAKNADNLAA